MSEILEIVKVTGPAIAIALVAAVAVWKQYLKLQRRCFDLYERLAGPKERLPDVVARYVQDFDRELSDLRAQIDALKSTP